MQSSGELSSKGNSNPSGDSNCGLNCGLKGDLKVQCVAFIWMRPSGTEPLLRVMADVKVTGSREEAQELHSLLLRWQHRMILAAQSRLQNRCQGSLQAQLQDS